jgi:hypothetical protein
MTDIYNKIFNAIILLNSQFSTTTSDDFGLNRIANEELIKFELKFIYIPNLKKILFDI